MATVKAKVIPRFNKADLMVILDTSRTTINKHLNREDAPQPDDAGLYSLPQIVKYWVKRQSLDSARTGATDEAYKKAKAERRLSEIKVEQAENKLVNIAEVSQWVNNQMAGMKKQLLALPSSLASRLARTKNKKQASQILDQGIRDVVGSLQDYEAAAH